MKKLMTMMLGFSALAAASLAHVDAKAACNFNNADEEFMFVSPSSTSASACGSCNGGTACASTYWFFGGTLIVPTADVPSGNTYGDLAMIHCLSRGWTSPGLWQYYTSVGGGAGDQFAVCPAGDSGDQGLGGIAAF